MSSPASKNLCSSPALTVPTFFSYQPSPGTCDEHNLDFKFVKKLWFFMAARTPGCDHLPFLNTCPMLAAHEERTSAPSDSLISTFSFCLSSDNVFSFPALAVQRCITIPFALLCGHKEPCQLQGNIDCKDRHERQRY